MTASPQLLLRSHDAAWNRARWEQLPDDGNRYEVIEGVLYMTTAPSFFHQWIIRQLFLVLYAQVDSLGLGLTTWAPLGVFMPGCDPVQPDLVVVTTARLGIIHDRHVEGIPSLLVEVLSPSNPEVDTETKRRAYAHAAVLEYWIVRPASRDILLYTQPDAALGDYAHSQRIDPGAALVSATLPVRFAITGLVAGTPDATL